MPESQALKLFQEHYEGTYDTSRQLGGDVNHTYLLSNNKGEKVVFQRLSKIFNEKLIDDFLVVTKHLTKQGWLVPQLIFTTDDKSYASDEDGYVWRAISFVESDGTPSDVDMGSVGAILAKFHKTLSELDYEAIFKLAHYHDTPYYFKKLKELESQLSDVDRLLSTKVILIHSQLPTLPDTENQLIHADPRVDNILFKGSTPFTFIDFDTIMNGSVWIDLSDIVRSVFEKSVQQNIKTDFKEIRAFTDAYLEHSSFSFKQEEFFKLVLLATQHMAIELATRFLNDVVEDYYFVWENTPYKNRAEHNIARVKQQLEICERIETYEQRTI